VKLPLDSGRHRCGAASLIPQVGVHADEVGHHLNALGVVEDDDLNAPLPEQILRTQEVSIFADDDPGNPVKQSRSRAHDAGTELLTRVNSAQSRRRPALRMQTVSACAVGSPFCTRRLCPRATIRPCRSAKTEPMGRPPSRRPVRASSRAEWSSVLSVIEAGFPSATAISSQTISVQP
jgi:hypothetical protein